MITIREYKKAESLEEAWQLNQKRTNRIIGGMLWTKMSRGRVQTAIDLSGLGLDTIDEYGDHFSVGCMVTLRQLEMHRGIEAYSQGAVREALRHIVGVQFRNLATVGGSVFGRYGFSDVLTVLMMMDAEVELYKGGLVPVSEFARMPRDNDVLVRVLLRKTPAAYVYQSMRNTDTDFPVLTCGAAMTGKGLRICIGARPGRAVLLEDEGGMLCAPVTKERAAEIGAYAAERIPTGSNMRGSAEYRTHLVRVLVERAVEQMGEGCADPVQEPEPAERAVEQTGEGCADPAHGPESAKRAMEQIGEGCADPAQKPEPAKRAVEQTGEGCADSAQRPEPAEQTADGRNA